MSLFAYALLVGSGGSAVIRAQAAVPTTAPPASLLGVDAWDAAAVRRAAQLLSSPDRWDRSDTTNACSASAKTMSIYCALKRAAYEMGPPPGRDTTHAPTAPPAACRLQSAAGREEGSCGWLVDELPVLSMTRVPAVTTGRWRDDVHPTEVWAGVMVDGEDVLLDAARRLVNSIAPKKYSSRLIGYNNDPATSFADVQEYFRLLEKRVATQPASELLASGDSVEVEVYAGGTGVIRTFEGWYRVTDFAARDSMLHFRVDTAAELAASALDRKIIQRANEILASDAVWNRADDRTCKPGATTWSIYCALEQATIEVTGGFHHRRPALELVREIVEARTKDRQYNHRLMDYNNDSTTHLGDVRSLFAEALGRIKP
jgi:hypothetical protein